MWNNTKKSMEGLKLSDSVFSQWDVRSSLLKSMKTRQTKTWITQNFKLVWPIQGRTMWKLTSWGFRKCGTFRDLEVLNQSYRLSKSSQIWKKNISENGCQKKITRAQFLIKSLFLLREVSKLDLKTSLRRNKVLKKNCGRVFFLWHPLFSVTSPLLPPSSDFELQ